MAFVNTRRALLCLALSLGFLPTAMGQGKNSESVVKATAKEGAARDGKRVVVVELDISKGWHLYGNPAGNEDLESVKTTVTVTGEKAEVVYPKAKMVIDPVVGNYNTYEGKQKIEVLLPAGKSGPVKLQVSFQACDEKTCLQPAKMNLEVK